MTCWFHIGGVATGCETCQNKLKGDCMKLEQIKMSSEDQLGFLGINYSFSEEKMKQIIRLVEKTMLLLVLHDPVMGTSYINPKVVGSRIIQGMNDQESDLLLKKAVSHLIGMADDHCKIKNCFPDCNYWCECPLAIITNGPFRC